jgi:hypothetical protein
MGRIAYNLLCDSHPLRVSWFLVMVRFAQELSSANKNTPQKVICVDFAGVVSREFKDIFEVAIFNLVIKLQMPRLRLPMPMQLNFEARKGLEEKLLSKRWRELYVRVQVHA